MLINVPVQLGMYLPFDVVDSILDVPESKIKPEVFHKVKESSMTYSNYIGGASYRCSVGVIFSLQEKNVYKV